MGYPGHPGYAGHPGYPGPPPQQYPAAGYAGGPYRLTWEAFPPPRSGPFAGLPPRRPPYLGPPAYPAPPRWGLPRLVWRVPTTVPGTVVREARPAIRVVGQARSAVALLALVAISAALAGLGEIARYVLLVIGRGAVLPPGPVSLSDGLVNTCAWLALGTGVFAVALGLRWLFTVREVAADLAGRVPARPDWQVLLHTLLPVLNLAGAGSVLAEVEHAALHSPEIRPRPSRLVLGWWLAWVVCEVLAVLTLLLGLRTDIQSFADGVLWHAATDLAAAALAVVSVLVVTRLTGLLGSTPPKARRERVLTVTGAPEPPLRASRPVGATR